MDVSRLSRDELVFEARRLGIGDPESMGRAKLIRAIAFAKARLSVPRLAVKMAGSLLGGVVSLARGALGPPAHALGRSSSHPPPSSRPTAPPPSTASGRPTGDAPPSPTSTGPSAPTIASSDPPTEASESRTMARVLSSCGHARRALAIYERLLEQEPRNPDLRAEADEVRARLASEPPDASEMVSVGIDASTLLVAWDVRDPAVARARKVLGTTGELSVRVVITAPDAVHVVASRTREQRDVPPSGEWVLSDLPAESRATASVGLAAGERFVSIAHAPPRRLGSRV